MKIVIIPWNSSDYWAGIQLRNRLLKTSAGENWIYELPLNEQAAIHLVAKIDEQVVGTMMVCKNSKSEVQLKQVAIDEAYQGAGIGKKMLCFAEKMAELLGFTTVYLTGRYPAWGFYERYGYHGFGGSYQKKQLVMKRFKKNIAYPSSKGAVSFIKELTLKELETNG